MKLVLKNPTDAPCEPGKDINVLISGEDPGMTAKAYEILERLGRNLKEDGRLIHRNWDFETLIITALREIASAEAAMADIIILGVREDWELPWIVQTWMKRWLELRQARPGALVAVLDADLEKSAAARTMLSQLKHWAASGHLDFFVKSSHGGEEQRGDARLCKTARQFVMTRPPGRAARIAGRRRRNIQPGEQVPGPSARKTQVLKECIMPLNPPIIINRQSEAAFEFYAPRSTGKIVMTMKTTCNGISGPCVG